MRRALAFSLSASLAAILLVACSDGAPVENTPSGDVHQHGAGLILERSSFQAERIVHTEAFQQLGLLFDGTTAPQVRYRVDSEWRDAEITWSEGYHHVGRIVLDAPVNELELRSTTPLRNMLVELYPEPMARPELLARDLPFAEISRDDAAVRLAGIAPAELVISRAEWGARNPDKICGDAHEPYRMSVHHTASPDSDDGDPAARMRQMQAYHIDNNNWCDIGYHFVVSQSGLIFQGRSTEERSGAHVGNQNFGNIGVSLIGNFQAQQVGDPQWAATAKILKWVSETYDIPLNREVVKGHREWPGQSTSCPGDNVLNRFNDLLIAAGSTDPGAPPTPSTEAEVEFEVAWLDQPTDFYREGSSDGVPDVFPGETLRAEIRLTNTNTFPLRDVEFSYGLDSPYLSATNYLIESDHPAKDRQTWAVNDADSAPSNPAKDALGNEGTLTMYAFGAGESKRVTIELEAGPYSIGAVDHPDLRAWVRQIGDVYAVQEAWNTDPTLGNGVGRLVQDLAQVDVLSTAEWQFDAGEVDQLEGWTPCANGVASMAVEPEAGVLRMEVEGEGGCAASPAWTSIDAATWDQLVLRLRSAGEHHAVVYWAADGQNWSTLRAFVFEVDPGAQTYVLPLATRMGWEGEITNIWVMPFADGAGTIDIDAIFAQSSVTKTTVSAREDYVDGVVSEHQPDVDMPDPNIDGSGNNGGNNGGGGTDDDADVAQATSSSGCASAGPGNAAWPLLSLLGVLLFRRRG